jgi:hypothetical protein
VDTFAAAAHYIIAQASLCRLLAWALGISLLFAVYFALGEIDNSLGKGALWTLFRESPKSEKTAGGSSEHSNINGGDGRS